MIRLKLAGRKKEKSELEIAKRTPLLPTLHSYHKSIVPSGYTEPSPPSFGVDPSCIPSTLFKLGCTQHEAAEQ